LAGPFYQTVHEVTIAINTYLEHSNSISIFAQKFLSNEIRVANE